MNAMLRHVSKEYINKLCKLDMLLFTSLVSLELSFLGIIGYNYLTNQFSGIKLIVAGPEDDSSDFIILILLFQSFYMMTCVMVSSVLYIQMQLLCAFYCQSLNESFFARRQIRLDLLIERGRCINSTRRLINSSFGFVPFALTLTIWSLFVTGLSFSHTYDSIKGNIATLTLIFGSIAGTLAHLEALIRSTTFFKRKANEFRESCAKLASGPKMCEETMQYRMANLLHNFLADEKLPAMMAYDLFEIKSNLTLSLLDSMITFTVMAFTSFRMYLK